MIGPSRGSDAVIIVHVSDPVSSFRYLLDSYNHVAHRFSPAEKANAPVRYSQEGHAVSQKATPAPSPQAVRPASVQEDHPQDTNESLGTQVIEGVLAEGRKTTTIFPVGVMGNDRPIMCVNESWYSPDLKMTILSKSSDPRMGERTMRLQNIERTEPDPALFRVPPGYQIVDESGDQAEIKINRP